MITLTASIIVPCCTVLVPQRQVYTNGVEVCYRSIRRRHTRQANLTRLPMLQAQGHNLPNPAPAQLQYNMKVAVLQAMTSTG